MIAVEAASRTDIGKKRSSNEDSLLLDQEVGLYVVADGMGGHQAGEVASRLAVSTMHDYLKRFSGVDTVDAAVEELPHASPKLSRPANRLLAAIEMSHNAVQTLARSKPSLRGMGTTLSAVLLHDGGVVAANVGDSPIYLIRNGQSKPLFTPHTVLAEQRRMDRPAGGSEAAGSPFRHMLTQAIGVTEAITPGVEERTLQQGDVLLLCSDGLSDTVGPKETAAMVSGRPLEDAVETLLIKALERGGRDNITIVAVRVRSAGGKSGGGLAGKLFAGLRNMRRRGV